MEKNVLVATNISKSYVGVRALDKVSVTIKEGEVKCLAGENGCGKSTFVKLMSGVELADKGEGTIVLNGREIDKSKHNVISAINEGIQVIYQDLSLFDNMTVAENIALNKMIKEKRKLTNKKEVYEIAKAALEQIGVEMDLDAIIQEISIANRQIVAICRALALDAKLLFMDEPTTALTKKEIERLLDIVRALKAKGIAVVFISHKLDEVMSVADSITVFRDGKLVKNMEKDEFDVKKLVYYMTGREVEYSHYERKNTSDAPVLELKNMTKTGQYNNINLSVRAGDIVGLTGLLGSGRTELALSVFGLNPIEKGEICLNGKPVKIGSPVDAVRNGIALLPEERATQGLLLNKDMTDNVSVAILKQMTNAVGILNKKKRYDLANQMIKRFRVRIPNADTLIKTLSGGNQQKVVLGKWVASEPKLFILDSPTVGVDIGSKSEIYEQIQALAAEGMAVIIISDEVEEICANCNRVTVMFQGNIVKEFDEADMKGEDAQDKITEAIHSLTKSKAGKESETV
ncbi:MAG: sugar ABC transporter ATP-binding protein [Lachnospiraceae bacterium]|nr:sugar ABC transporter ATP-binding protein [Candidatus Equihabitans merdae]